MSDETTALVTGAPGEIAIAVAERLSADDRYRVVLSSRRSGGIWGPSQATLVPGVDLADYDQVLRLFARDDIANSPRLALVLAAGTFPKLPEVLPETQASTADALRDNFLTFANCIHAAIPLLRRNGRGHIVGFTSLTQTYNYPYSAAFNAAKAACEAFAASVANENSQFGIAVNMLALSTVNTEHERRMKPHGDQRSWLSPAEVARYTHWLLELEPPVMTGARLPLYHHSTTFFGEGYLSRIART